jgi:hypothetical protein
MTFEEQYEALQAVIPDLPRDIPAYTVNPPLWAFWRTVEPSAPEHPVMTEQEIVRRLDILYCSDGTCNI